MWIEHKGHAKKEAHSDSPVEELISDSESGEGIADGDSSDSEKIQIDYCTCGAEGRAHKRGCLLSYRNPLSGRTLFPAPSNPEAHADPRTLEPEHVSSPPESVPSEDVKSEMKVGDYVCIIVGDYHVPCRIVGKFAVLGDTSYLLRVREMPRSLLRLYFTLKTGIGPQGPFTTKGYLAKRPRGPGCHPQRHISKP